MRPKGGDRIKKWVSLGLLLVLPVLAWAQNPRGAKLQDAATTGNGTAMDVSMYSYLLVAIIGSAGSDRVVTFSGSQDGTNYGNVLCTSLAATTQATSQTASGTTLFQWRCPVAGLRFFRTPVSGGTTGSVTVTATAMPYVSMGGSGGSGLDISGTPSANQLAVWSDADTLSGTNALSLQVTTLDLTGADSTAPNKTGTTPPATCTLGDTFFDSDYTAGWNVIPCTGSNTWTPPLATSPVITGNWQFTPTSGVGLRFGGTSGSFPGLRHNGNELWVRTASDSTFAPLAALSLDLYTSGAVAKFSLAPSSAVLGIASDAKLGWSSSTTAGGTKDAFIGRRGAASFVLGDTDNATPVSQTLGTQNGTGTNIAGGTLTLQGGLGTGNAVPGVVAMAGGAVSATSGTTGQTAVTRSVLGATKVLTDGSVTNLVNATIANGSAIGGVIEYTIEATDGTDYQAETGRVLYSAVNKAGTVTRTITEDADTTQAVSAGTLTTTWAISAANPAVISVSADTSLTPSTGFPRITYSIKNMGQQAIAIQ